METYTEVPEANLWFSPGDMPVTAGRDQKGRVLVTFKRPRNVVTFGELGWDLVEAGVREKMFANCSDKELPGRLAEMFVVEAAPEHSGFRMRFRLDRAKFDALFKSQPS